MTTTTNNLLSLIENVRAVWAKKEPAHVKSRALRTAMEEAVKVARMNQAMIAFAIATK